MINSKIRSLLYKQKLLSNISTSPLTDTELYAKCLFNNFTYYSTLNEALEDAQNLLEISKVTVKSFPIEQSMSFVDFYYEEICKTTSGIQLDYLKFILTENLFKSLDLEEEKVLKLLELTSDLFAVIVKHREGIKWDLP